MCILGLATILLYAHIVLDQAWGRLTATYHKSVLARLMVHIPIWGTTVSLTTGAKGDSRLEGSIVRTKHISTRLFKSVTTRIICLLLVVPKWIPMHRPPPLCRQQLCQQQQLQPHQCQQQQ